MTARNVLAALILLPFALGLAPAGSQAEDRPRTVTVSAVGSVEAEPDVAVVSIGVETENERARPALDSNANAMNKVVSGLKAAGIEARDIATETFAISPIYDQRKSASGGYSPRTAGFRVVNTVRVTIRRIADTGRLIDRSVELGANRLGAVDFQVSDLEDRLDGARRDAMRNAIRRARLYAQAAGASLGDVLTISENVSRGSPPIHAARMRQSSSSPVEPGQQTLSVNLNVVWALK